MSLTATASHCDEFVIYNLIHYAQWRRQRSEGTRSFRGQKILKTGHPDAFFSSKKLTTFFSCRPQNTGRQRRYTVKIKQIKRSDTVKLHILGVPMNKLAN